MNKVPHLTVEPLERREFCAMVIPFTISLWPEYSETHILGGGESVTHYEHYSEFRSNNGSASIQLDITSAW